MARDINGPPARPVSGSVTTNFLYDGSTLVAEYPGIASTYHASGVSFTDGATGSRFFYRENALGSNLAVVASTGNLVSRTEYEVYGLERPILAGTNTSLRFAGKHGYYKDDSSGLSLLGQRFYSPRIGKFLTQDPIGHSGGIHEDASLQACKQGRLSCALGKVGCDDKVKFFGTQVLHFCLGCNGCAFTFLGSDV